MFRRNSVAFTEADLHISDSERLKRDSIANYIPKDQLIYKIDAIRIIPKNHHEHGVEGDAIPLGTRFDQQASLGKFIYHELDDLYLDDGTYEELQQTKQYSDDLSEYCSDLIKCSKLRDKYIKLSNQRNFDDPSNHDQWETYPRPPAKGWHYTDDYGKSEYYFDVTAAPRYSGENFDLNDYVETCLKPKLKANQIAATELKEDKCGYYFDGFGHCNKPSFKEFLDDLNHIVQTSISKTGSQLSDKRIEFLRAKFESYSLLNENREIYLTKMNPHRDFYNARKIDNSINVSMSMSKQHLLYVINQKLKEEPKRVVYEENGIKMTLEELFKPYFEDDSSRRFNIDDLFEFGLIDKNFSNEKTEYSDDTFTSYEHIIENEALLRIDKTFLRFDNAINGEYLTLIMKYVLSDYEKTKYQYGEMGINFNLMTNYKRFGCKTKWNAISSWVVDNKLVSHNVKWNIRIPRNYPDLRKANKVRNFQEFIDLVFKDLYEVSMDPLSNHKLHFFLTKVSSLQEVIKIRVYLESKNFNHQNIGLIQLILHTVITCIIFLLIFPI